MTPSDEILSRYARVERATDALGRVIGVKKLRPIDQAKAIDFAGTGPDSFMASLYLAAMAVCEIDGDPIPSAKSSEELATIVNILDEEGLSAIREGLSRFQPKTPEEVVAKAGE